MCPPEKDVPTDFHTLPFHASANTPGVRSSPTARHLVADAHDTDCSHGTVCFAAGAGAATEDQLFPFQRSTTTPPDTSPPTAKQLASAGHETDHRMSSGEDPGPVALHALPFHRSMSSPALSLPTATQNDFVRQDTP